MLNDSTIAFSKGLYVNRLTIEWTDENKWNKKIYNFFHQHEERISIPIKFSLHLS
jgi:hypothetical protein